MVIGEIIIIASLQTLNEWLVLYGFCLVHLYIYIYTHKHISKIECLSNTDYLSETGIAPGDRNCSWKFLCLFIQGIVKSNNQTVKMSFSCGKRVPFFFQRKCSLIWDWLSSVWTRRLKCHSNTFTVTVFPPKSSLLPPKWELDRLN